VGSSSTYRWVVPSCRSSAPAPVICSSSRSSSRGLATPNRSLTGTGGHGPAGWRAPGACGWSDAAPDAVGTAPAAWPHAPGGRQPDRRHQLPAGQLGRHLTLRASAIWTLSRQAPAGCGRTGRRLSARSRPARAGQSGPPGAIDHPARRIWWDRHDLTSPLGVQQAHLQAGSTQVQPCMQPDD
jgi:hypothetical protein